MKLILKLSAISMMAVGTTLAQDLEKSIENPFDGFSALLSYKNVPLKQTFSHNTAPSDAFLPNSDVPGSAGTTSLNHAQYISLGL